MNVKQKALSTVLKQLERCPLRLSNKRALTSGISFRVWGDLRVQDIERELAPLGFRSSQPLRWYENGKGMGAEMAANCSWTRKLGLGEELAAEVRVLHTGIIVLQLQ